MRSMTRVCAAMAGVLAVALVVGPARNVCAVEASILKDCVGPPGQPEAFVGDQIQCSIAVANTKPQIADICLTSVVDAILREGVAECAGGACSCVGGTQDGQSCATNSDCPPLSGPARGVCARNAPPQNLLPCDQKFTCAGGTRNEMDCNDTTDCPDGICCVRLGGFVVTGVNCLHLDTVQTNDNDPLTDEAIADGIDLATGASFKLRFQASLDIADLDCGDRLTEPCLVTVESQGQSLGSFCEEEGVLNCDHFDGMRPALQQAVDAAPDGATLTVTGRCSGPIRIKERENLIVQGVLPPGSDVCQDGSAPLRSDLRSTVAGGCDSPDVSDCELIKIISSKNVTVRYLNIVDSFNSGLEYKRSRDGVAFCNCVTRNAEEGIEFDKGKGRHLALQNLVRENALALEPDIDAGIGVHDSPKNRVEANTVVANLQGGIFVENDADETIVVNNTVRENLGNGIQVVESNENTIEANIVEDNTLNGILLDSTKENRVVGNTVSSNDGKGIQVSESDDNTIDGNMVGSNGGGAEAEQIVCDLKSDDNTGTNEINGGPVPVALPNECL